MINSLRTKNISLIKVKISKSHIDILFKLLKKRKAFTNISHHKVPSYEQHKRFVNSEPYRYWFLIRNNNSYKGSTLITKNNEISIKLLKHDNIIFSEIIGLIMKNIKPLKEIPSIRNGNFIFNVSPKNKEVIKTLNNIKCQKIQETYKIIIDNL
tara:strand:- start:2890 stop:3351 length:462 start_codon:yes stop_codon:yes gene_type:complete